jgi:hypothetical protein
MLSVALFPARQKLISFSASKDEPIKGIKIMEHPDLLLNQFQLQHQDRLRKVETWRLVLAARQNRAKYMGHLLQCLVAAARQHLRVQGRPKSVKPDLAVTGQAPR